MSLRSGDDDDERFVGSAIEGSVLRLGGDQTSLIDSVIDGTAASAREIGQPSLAFLPISCELGLVEAGRRHFGR